MNREHFASPSHSLTEELHSLFGEVKPTTGRFNLVRPSWTPEKAQDVILPKPLPRDIVRVLAVEASLVDEELHQSLKAARVPILPDIVLGHQPADMRLFGVKAGLKLLTHEALFSGRESSETYISDAEIYQEAGRIYGKAWRVTGRLMLDPGYPPDAPTDHLAISSFSDGQSFLFLCPPFDSGPQLDGQEALNTFGRSMLAKLQSAGGGAAWRPERQGMVNGLVEVAMKGFREEMQQ